MKTASRLTLLLVLALVLILMAVPNTVLAFLRIEYGWLGRLASWVDALWPGVDAGHLLAFGALGLLGAFAWPRLGWATALLVLGALAAATEVLQYWVPGRTPRWGDVVADVSGGAAGFAAARLCQAATAALGQLFRRPG